MRITPKSRRPARGSSAFARLLAALGAASVATATSGAWAHAWAQQAWAQQAWAQCGSGAIRPQAVAELIATPDAVLSSGDLVGLVSLVRDAAAADPAAAAAASRAAGGLAPGRRRAVGVALAQAAARCNLARAETQAQAIQQSVIASADAALLAGYQSVAGDAATTAIVGGAGGASAGGALGGGGVLAGGRSAPALGSAPFQRPSSTALYANAPFTYSPARAGAIAVISRAAAAVSP